MNQNWGSYENSNVESISRSVKPFIGSFLIGRVIMWGKGDGYCQGVIQAKAEVGHRGCDSWVWDTKPPNSKNVYMIKLNKRAKTKQKN